MHQENENSNSAPVFHFLTHKAGMDSIDPQKVSQIVLEASKNSEFYKRQQEKKQKYDEKIMEMQKTIEHYFQDPCQMSILDQQIEACFNQYEQERYLKKNWVAFDLDMFFVACEIRDNPSLEGKPVAVGGLSMISTANYVARKFGVRSAMPGFIAKKLCPELILIPGNYRKYEETSKIFKDILKTYDPEMESMGLDEANLDMTNYLNENNLHETSQIEELCKKIRETINEATKITVSCGIAPNKMLAKMCSEINKPNGQFLLKNNKETILEFMAKRPIRKIPGIGSVSEQLLIGLGIHSCEDLLKKQREVKICFTENAFEFFMKSALGIARCFHEKFEDRKSFSVSRTFPTISSLSDMEAKLKDLAESIADDLQYCQKMAKHISVNVKTHKFEVKSKNMILDKYIKSQEEIYSIACKLLKQLWPLDPVRLLGIKLSDLIDEQSLKEKGIEKYLVKQSKAKISEEPIKIDDELNPSDPNYEDKFIVNEIDKILELENIKEKLPENDENSHHSTITQKEKKTAKENKIPQVFLCCICNQEINCGGNSIRMNNHIDKCLMALDKKPEEEETKVDFRNFQKNFDSNMKKRKQNEKSPEIQKDAAKNIKSNKKDNRIKQNSNKTLDAFFSKK